MITSTLDLWTLAWYALVAIQPWQLLVLMSKLLPAN